MFGVRAHFLLGCPKLDGARKNIGSRARGGTPGKYQAINEYIDSTKDGATPYLLSIFHCDPQCQEMLDLGHKWAVFPLASMPVGAGAAAYRRSGAPLRRGVACRQTAHHVLSLPKAIAPRNMRTL